MGDERYRSKAFASSPWKKWNEKGLRLGGEQYPGRGSKRASDGGLYNWASDSCYLLRPTYVALNGFSFSFLFLFFKYMKLKIIPSIFMSFFPNNLSCHMTCDHFL